MNGDAAAVGRVVDFGSIFRTSVTETTWVTYHKGSDPNGPDAVPSDVVAETVVMFSVGVG